MEGRFRRKLFAVAATLLPVTVHAFSYAPISDAALHDQADAIVIARVVDVIADEAGVRPATRYRLRTEQGLKGAAAGGDVDIVVPGGSNRHGTFALAGAPRFHSGERALLFLRNRGDGTHAVMQYALGAFHIRADKAGRDVLIRDLHGAQAVSMIDGTATAHEAEPLRNLERFAAWLSDRARGAPRPADYWLPHDGQTMDIAKYQLPRPTLVRWAEFDENLTIEWYASSTSLLGLLGGGYGEFQQALTAWNADAASTIQFVYRGSTTATGGLSQPDGVNTIQFSDPDDVLAGVFDCLSGGVLATTGTWVGNAQAWSGGTSLPLVEADIVVQDGAACFLGLLGNANAAELFTHELGHALGLSHSCGESPVPECVAGSAADDAVMRPVLHGDGRGARLGVDDRDGVAYLYPATTQQGGSGTPTPTSGAESGGGGGGTMPRLVLLGLLLAALRRARIVSRSPC